MTKEINLPYFFKLGEIGRRGKIDIPKRNNLLKALQNKGYQASATHINPQAIKTNADMATCISTCQTRKSI